MQGRFDGCKDSSTHTETYLVAFRQLRNEIQYQSCLSTAEKSGYDGDWRGCHFEIDKSNMSYPGESCFSEAENPLSWARTQGQRVAKQKIELI